MVARGDFDDYTTLRGADGGGPAAAPARARDDDVPAFVGGADDDEDDGVLSLLNADDGRRSRGAEDSEWLRARAELQQQQRAPPAP